MWLLIQLIIFQCLAQAVEVFQSLTADIPSLNGPEQGASRFALMTAVTEFTGPQVIAEFYEAVFQFVTADLPEAEFTYAG